MSQGARDDQVTTSRLEVALDTAPGQAVDMAAATVRQEEARARMARRVTRELSLRRMRGAH